MADVTPKKGMLFEHATWLDSQDDISSVKPRPSIAVVTKIGQGVVYYRLVYLRKGRKHDLGSAAYFPIADSSKYIKRVLNTLPSYEDRYEHGTNPIKWPGYSKDAVRLNIADLMHEGRSQKQAIAIAIHNARQAYRHKYPTRAWPHWLKPMAKTNPLTDDEEKEFRMMRGYAPYRDWHAVKPKDQPAAYFDSRGKATAFAKKNAPAEIFRFTANNPLGAQRRKKAAMHEMRGTLASAQKEAAAKLFEKFTGHKGAVVKTINIPELPKAVAVIGKIDGILYETVRDGVQERYKHTFKKHARPLFCVSHDGRQIVLIGGSYDFTARGIVDRTK